MPERPKMTLNRRDQILKLIVEHFVKTAQPVGSQTLIDEYHLKYSSATIRNEMNALEQLGFLEKTHSSSGRVPSSEGYRFYCEYLRDKDIDDSFKALVNQILDEKTKSIDEIVKSSCQILSHMTSLASVVLGPNINEERLASIQCIPLSPTSVSVIFVTNQGFVQNKTFVIQDETTVNDLKQCLQLFNDRLVGTPICDLIEKTEALRPVLNDYIVNHDVVYKAMIEAFVKFASDRLSLYGKNELFEQPEFASDAENLKKVIKLLESPHELKKSALNSESDYKEGNITIHIGASNDKANSDISIVTTKLKIGDMPEGTIALVGPKRMDYDTVVSALEFIIAQINERFKKESE